MAEQTEKKLTIVSPLLTKYLGEEVVQKVLEPTPREIVKNRQVGGGGSADYVEGHNFIKKFNECFGFLWSHNIIEHFREGDHIVVLGEVSFKIPGRTITKEYPDGTKETVIIDSIEVTKTQFGGSEIKRYSTDSKNKRGDVTHKKGDVIDLANDFKGAATDSMKKCGLEIGFFSDVYGVSREDSDGGKGPLKSQLDKLYEIGEDVGLTNEEVTDLITKEFKCRPEKLDPLQYFSAIAVVRDAKKEQSVQSPT